MPEDLLIDTGAGGGNDEGAGSGGAGGDQGGAGGDQGGTFEEFPADDNASSGDEGADSSGDGRDQGADADGKEGQPDRRKITQAIRAHLSEIKKTNPALGKELERLAYKTQQFDTVGSYQELKQLKETVELHGGPEGLASMAEEVEASRELEEGFKAGDPKLIDGWATDYPDGFKRLVLPAIDRLEQMDEGAWKQTAATVSTKFLEKFGVFNAMRDLGGILTKLNDPEAQRIYNEIVGKVLKPMMDLAKKSGEADPLAGERSKIAEERASIATEKQKVFYGNVRSEVNVVMTAAINKQLRTLLAGRRIESGTANRVRKEINAELSRVVNSKADYQKQYKSVMSGGKKEAAVKLITTRAQAELSSVVKMVLKDFQLLRGGGAGGNGAKDQDTRRAAGGSGNRSASGQPQVIIGKPKAGEVDWTRSEKSTFILPKGQVWLKNGKQAKWG